MNTTNTTMNIAIDEHIIRIVVVTLSDRVDAFNAPALRERLDGLLADGVARFVLDLARVPFMDSAGMAVLVGTMKQARQAGGDAKLVWPASDAAQRVLRLTRFDRVFDMSESAEAALAAF